MSHVSGNATTKNAPTLTNETVIVPFNLPAGGSLLLVDVASSKVSLNGNVLPHAAYSLALSGSDFEVTNDQAASWPAVSSIVVEAFYPSQADQAFNNLVLTLDDHEVRITALENAAP